MRKISDIKKIIVHCSDSTFGDIATIDRWHKERGWSGIGYHYVITNGVAQKHDQYDSSLDGLIQKGREWQKTGAHCKGQNRDSIGICLIGRHHFTAQQLLVALPNLLIMLGDLGIGADNIFGHCEFDKSKTCPNIDPILIRNMVRLRRDRKAFTLPPAGRIVSLQDIEEICLEYHLYDLWEKIANDSPTKPFKSDGCSWWPDEWKSKTGEIISIYPRCFKHDLIYWAGYPEKDNITEQIERFCADADLVTGVVKDTGRVDLGDMMFPGVRIGGHEKWHMPFSWGFGRK